MRLLSLSFALIVLFRGGFDDIEWRDDLDMAKVEAARSGKPIFLHFGADW